MSKSLFQQTFERIPLSHSKEASPKAASLQSPSLSSNQTLAPLCATLEIGAYYIRSLSAPLSASLSLQPANMALTLFDGLCLSIVGHLIYLEHFVYNQHAINKESLRTRDDTWQNFRGASRKMKELEKQQAELDNRNAVQWFVCFVLIVSVIVFYVYRLYSRRQQTTVVSPAKHVQLAEPQIKQTSVSPRSLSQRERARMSSLDSPIGPRGFEPSFSPDSVTSTEAQNIALSESPPETPSTGQSTDPSEKLSEQHVEAQGKKPAEQPPEESWQRSSRNAAQRLNENLLQQPLGEKSTSLPEKTSKKPSPKASRRAARKEA